MVIQAFVAAEDARFFQHQGFDMQSMSRAFFKNLEAGKIVQGGSTITQQVAKALYLSPETELHPEDQGGAPGLQDRPLSDQGRDHHPLSEPHLPRPRHLRRRGGLAGVFREKRPRSDAGGSGHAGRPPQGPQQLLPLPAPGQGLPAAGLRPEPDVGRRLHFTKRRGTGRSPRRSGSVRSSRRTRSPRTSSRMSAATSRRSTAATSSTRRGSRSTRR